MGFEVCLQLSNLLMTAPLVSSSKTMAMSSIHLIFCGSCYIFSCRPRELFITTEAEESDHGEVQYQEEGTLCVHLASKHYRIHVWCNTFFGWGEDSL